MRFRPLLLGHRGARRYKPENTLAAFDLALTHGCDGFEFDVRLTSDGKAVICHDPEHDGLPVAAALRSHPAMQDLADLESILTLYSGVFLDIELKVREAVPAVAAALDNRVFNVGYVVSSFLPEALADMYSIKPSVPLGLIADDPARLELWRELPVQYVVSEQVLANQALIEKAHAAQKKVLVWTVNDEARMRELFAIGVDGIVSDDTLLLCRVAQ